MRDLVGQRSQFLGDKGPFAGQHLVGDHRQRELVRTAIHGFAQGLLRGHVAGRAKTTPAWVASCEAEIFATPKSVIFTVPSSWIMMLAGLMSRWTIALLVGEVQGGRRLAEDSEQSRRLQRRGPRSGADPESGR